MAKARRRSPSRAGKKWHGPLLLIVGLLLGAVLMWGTQYYLYRDGKPFSGLAGLFAAGKKAMDKPREAKPQPEAEHQPKPKFDFYTILPEVETVLPEPKAAGKKTAKIEAPEAGVVYVLQAASYGNLNDADHLRATLLLNGLEAHIEKISIQGKGDYYRVRLGPYSSLDALDAANGKLAKLGIKAIRIKVRKGAV
jgi:cell division protein FtsN